ncbi:Membrane-associated phospholipid phosphatase [Dyella sp. OK004]|uniref:phosphatase PAP2 family protein n=1 Tax=Dyella sp. OK004 TaxID=1855292 RepID=UPI0008E22B7E|nr:phosphatase PAP2 family protein [Dyella sp. OK004]SFS11952.1 Membrane-associated phospholipid phosphatase [Dyella sp. OK004]
MRTLRFILLLLVIVLCTTLLPENAWAGGGPLGIDHTIHYDNTGIWKRSNQQVLLYGTVLSVAGGALWLGDDNQLGDTLWRSVDSIVVTSVSAQALKWTFQRKRPTQSKSPNQWFQGIHAQSFPSGEVSTITAAVTPIIATYGDEHPAVYALALLPVYDAVARMKNHAHWQTDVLAGAALGVGVGLWAEHRKSPWIVGLLPGGFQVGFQKKWD